MLRQLRRDERWEICWDWGTGVEGFRRLGGMSGREFSQVVDPAMCGTVFCVLFCWRQWKTCFEEFFSCVRSQEEGLWFVELVSTSHVFFPVVPWSSIQIWKDITWTPSAFLYWEQPGGLPVIQVWLQAALSREEDGKCTKTASEAQWDRIFFQDSRDIPSI